MNKYKIAFIACFTSLVFTAQAAVWFVATNGNDNNAGDVAHPFKTLPAAIEAANPGDEIQLRGGNYTSQEIRVNKSNLYIRSYPGEWAILTAVTNIEDVSSCIWYNEPETTGGTLERLEIIGGYYYGIKFETNWDWDNSIPFAQRRGVSNVTVRDCKIHDTGRDAIKLTPACANISIITCEIYYTGTGPGAQLDFNAEGIDNVNAPNLTVRGCHIHDIATTGIYVKGGGQNCVIEGNRVQNCGEGGIYLGFYTDAEWFNTDPQLTESYHLTAISPCINTGVNIPVVTQDFDGHLRTDGANDIGADEFGTTSGVSWPSQTAGYPLQILGNPVSDQVVFSMSAEKNRSTMLSLTGLDGKLWLLRPLEITTGENRYTVYVNDLPAGYYVLSIGTAHQQFVKH